MKITGKTYQYRDMLKKAGLRWSPGTKSWDGETADPEILTLISSGILWDASQRSTEPCPRCGSYCYGDCAGGD